ncbi:MAG: EVE domain-containing protein [Polyangia bacterium]
MKYWIMKSEPSAYAFDDLVRDGRSLWTGVRNYQARNLMDEMKVGDLVLFYHSSCDPPGIAGLAKVSATAVADPTQFDPKSDYFEKRATKDVPVWRCVEVVPMKKAATLLPLETLRAEPALADMVLLQRGSRLSVQPVDKPAFDRIAKLATLK